MKRILGIILFALLILLIYVLNTPMGATPAIGRFFSPTHGFWKNADGRKDARERLTIKCPSGNKVTVVYDEHRVPHIFASNEDDLFFAQGYITARERLWQMEFQTHFAAGRISEIVGEKGIELDRYNRRIGMAKVAEETFRDFADDTLSLSILENYTAGVNKYIRSLKSSELPIEYKLLGYKPEPWTPLKCILLLKYMANTLTGGDTDLEYTNALRIFGRDVFDKLYPDFPQDQDPIIPAGTKFARPQELVSGNQQVSAGTLYKIPEKHQFEPPAGLGSNNWALSGTKTASGKPILSNDPHLVLSFPSIWLQMQLHAPGYNAVGVTIPGAPGIIIGHNENIAWGVTNGTVDVRDWYSIQYKNDNKNLYRIGDSYYPFQNRVENIIVKNGTNVRDTVRWTLVGPVVYDKGFGKNKEYEHLAMRWQANVKSNEMMTFYLLNKAENHQDYLLALNHFECPAQNFVYADRSGQIAIKQQGKLPVHIKEGGKFITPLANVDLNAINAFIPFNENPYILNPERGFVSSANQHPTDDTYPYYYQGSFEYQRNRRINNVLKDLKKATAEDMQALQNDNYSMLAAEALPVMLEKLALKGNAPEKHKKIHKSLSEWNYMADEEMLAPTLFYEWWKHLEILTWDEFDRDDATLELPNAYILSRLIKSDTGFALFDIKDTPAKETAADLIRLSFEDMVAQFTEETPDWRHYKNSRIMHLVPQLTAFSRTHIPVGGYNHIVNAASEIWGPSWRMIVDFGKGKPEASGIYPAGQSGNPGSRFYDNWIDPWAAGQYNPVIFFKNLDEALQYSKK
jgi:penicillin G amidase